MKWITEITEKDYEWLLNACKKLQHIFKTKGKEGVRKYYKKYRSPVVCRNHLGKVFEMGWVVENGTLLLFMDARMVPDGHGRFKCQDCGRGYFQCACLETDSMHPFPLAPSRRKIFESLQEHKTPDSHLIVMADDLTGFNFEEGSLRSSRGIPTQAPNYEYLNHLDIGE